MLLLHRRKTGGRLNSTYSHWGPEVGWLLPGESGEECARRVCLDHAGIKISDTREVGVIRIYAQSQRAEPDRTIHVFASHKVDDVLLEKREHKFLGRTWEYQWFPVEKLPLRKMSDEDEYWVPYLFASRKFEFEFYYKGPYEDTEEILGFKVSIE